MSGTSIVSDFVAGLVGRPNQSNYLYIATWVLIRHSIQTKQNKCENIILPREYILKHSCSKKIVCDFGHSKSADRGLSSFNLASQYGLGNDSVRLWNSSSDLKSERPCIYLVGSANFFALRLNRQIGTTEKMYRSLDQLNICISRGVVDLNSRGDVIPVLCRMSSSNRPATLAPCKRSCRAASLLRIYIAWLHMQTWPDLIFLFYCLNIKGASCSLGISNWGPGFFKGSLVWKQTEQQATLTTLCHIDIVFLSWWIWDPEKYRGNLRIYEASQHSVRPYQSAGRELLIDELNELI